MTQRYTGFDGTELAWHEIGSGRPLLFLPGFGGQGSQLLRWGPATDIAAKGYRLLLPDFRGYGDSTTPGAATAYPPDVLTEDALALVAFLGFGDGDYDLAGYSLGARVVLRMLARGATPRRAIAAGQGLAKVTGPQQAG
ncbi:alpha/beta fold hydrolase [Nocardia yunnanensis]|uniref:alpha/beta fold hydrolase n=1 Tax=Nocardia yunnanensis TaxID=2382165 RepID=UPI001CA3BF17|nr:alpha/beta fold hydrolase [Nocardia yunnanensis]